MYKFEWPLDIIQSSRTALTLHGDRIQDGHETQIHKFAEIVLLCRNNPLLKNAHNSKPAQTPGLTQPYPTKNLLTQ